MDSSSSTPSKQMALALSQIQGKDDTKLIGTLAYETTNKRQDLDPFFQEMKQMVTGTSYILQEKLWDMELCKPAYKHVQVMKSWFISSTKITSARGLSEEEFYLLMISYIMAVNPNTWNPPPITFKGYAVPVPLAEIIFAIWLALIPSAGEITDQPFESNVLSLIPQPVWEDEIMKTKGKGSPAHSTTIQAPPKAKHITADEKSLAEDKYSTAPPPDKQFQAIMDGLNALQSTVAQQGAKISRIESHKGISPTATPFDPPSCPGKYSRGFIHDNPNFANTFSAHSTRAPAQAGPSSMETGDLISAGSSSEVSLELVKVIQSLTERKNKNQESHIAKAWEETVLPKVTVEHMVKAHDYSQNSYGQRSAVNAAKVLLQLYDLQASHPQNPSKTIAADSPFHPIAAQQTKVIQDALMAHAYPKNDKPLQKERKQILAAVMGPDLSAKDLAEAYSSESSFRGNGNGRGKRGRGWRGRGDRGGYRGRGSNRGRGRGGRGRGRGDDGEEEF